MRGTVILVIATATSVVDAAVDGRTHVGNSTCQFDWGWDCMFPPVHPVCAYISSDVSCFEISLSRPLHSPSHRCSCSWTGHSAYQTHAASLVPPLFAVHGTHDPHIRPPFVFTPSTARIRAPVPHISTSQAGMFLGWSKSNIQHTDTFITNTRRDTACTHTRARAHTHTDMGDDLPGGWPDAKSADECCTLCNANDNCKFWSFIMDSSPTQCALKTGLGTRSANSNRISGSRHGGPAPPPSLPFNKPAHYFSCTVNMTGAPRLDYPM
jgi:hypothetical protein